eukprot:Trichotokara_eunicae@DN5344_c0_g1_i2.p1
MTSEENMTFDIHRMSNECDRMSNECDCLTTSTPKTPQTGCRDDSLQCRSSSRMSVHHLSAVHTGLTPQNSQGGGGLFSFASAEYNNDNKINKENENNYLIDENESMEDAPMFCTDDILEGIGNGREYHQYRLMTNHKKKSAAVLQKK